MSLHDLRVWEPDETCDPFTWETCLNQGGSGPVGSFRVPPGMVAIIYARVITSTIDVDKNTARWNLVKDGATAQPIRTCGSLTEVEERNAAGANLIGMALAPGCGAIPCRYILEGGLYFVVQTGAPGGIVSLLLSGYTFRERR